MTKAQKARIDRRNNMPFVHIYPSTTNLYEQVVLSIPAKAKKRDIVQAIIDLSGRSFPGGFHVRMLP